MDNTTIGLKYSNIVNSFLELNRIYRQFRIEQKRDYDYVIGQMVDDETRKKLKDSNRPIFEFQIASQPMEYLAGMLRKEGNRMKAIPYNEGDEDKAKAHSLLTNWAIGERGYREIAMAAIDAAIGKVGYINEYWSYRDNVEGEFVCESVDPFLVMGDPEARHIDQSDWNYLCYSPFMSAEDILEAYKKYLTPEQVEKIKQSADQWEGAYRKQSLPKSWYDKFLSTVKSLISRSEEISYFDSFKDAKKGLYRVVEWHDKRMGSSKVVYNARTRANREVEDFNSEINPFEETFMNVNSHKMYVTVICPALLPDEIFMEKPYNVQQRGFALKPIYFRKWHPDITKTQSLMDRLVAPADFYNQRMMTSLECAMDAVNPPVEAPVDSIPPEHLEGWQSKERGIIRFYKAVVGGAKPERKPPGGEAFQMLRTLAEEGRDLMEWISGISPNARGYQESAGESGRLFRLRSAQTEIMVTEFLMNVSATTKDIFCYCNRTLQKFMILPRMIRLLDEEDNPYWLPVNIQNLYGVKFDITQGEYDFIPDSSVTGQTTKHENLAIMADTSKLVQVDPITSMFVAGKIYKNLDIPDGKEISKFIDQRLGIAMNTEMQNRVRGDFAQNISLAEQMKLLSQGPGNGKEKHPLEKV